MAILSQRAYARHRGVFLSAVQKAIETGRISTQPDGRIDSEQGDVEWVAALVAAETDAAKCYEVLATEVRRASNEFADSNG